MSAAPRLERVEISLEFLKGSNAGKVIKFNNGIISIGREPGNDIVFSQDIKVSRKHAVIEYSDGKFSIKNLNDKNFTIVDGLKVDSKILVQGSIVVIGQQEFRVLIPRVSQSENKENLNSKISKNLVPNSNNYAPPSPAIPIPKTKPISFEQAKPTNFNQEFDLPSPPKSNNSRIKFYAILAVLGVLVYFFLFDESGPKKVKKELDLRNAEKVAEELKQLETSVTDIESNKEKLGQNTAQYRAAQENYLRGFRDYRNGQYGRAMQAFQAAIALYPSHELARRYLTLSRVKFDEIIQRNMIQGRRYRANSNFRLCKASFEKVLIMVKDPNDPIYIEAKKYFDECYVRLGERY